MKDYIIWLKSGECITGTAREKIIKELQARFKDDEDGEKISFNDEDGEVVLELSRVEAIALNKKYESNQIGFVES